MAGVINSIAGGGTLITFPVLLWMGLDAKIANATSTVALWPGLFGGLFGYRKELENSATVLLRLGLTSVIGGAIGAWLLIWTPSPIFERLVPPDSVRNYPVHGPSPDYATSATATNSRGTENELVVGCDCFSVFFVDVWGLFRSRQRHPDACSPGFTGCPGY